MSDDSLTHADLSRLLGVSVTTLKSYRRKFPGFIIPLNAGKPLRFPAAAAPVCAAIRDGFARGLAVPEVHALLTDQYPKLSANRHLSIMQPAPGPEPDPAPDHLARALAELARRLDSALARLDRLEARPAPGPETGRVIRIRTRDGEHQRYRLTPLGADPEEPAPAPRAPSPLPDPTPPPEILDNPLVVRSDQGEFLGITGNRSRHFRLRDLLAILGAKHPSPRPPSWSPAGAAWTLAIPLGADPFRQDHVLDLEPTTTPRGNHVTLLQAMSVGGKPVPPSFLHAFLRQIGKEQE